ncbi:MAG: hypothetical protein H6R18_2461, partial [Proteobacteria bacterium]|nr:hypothetical protein [Pseudomonadota bacterium]
MNNFKRYFSGLTRFIALLLGALLAGCGGGGGEGATGSTPGAIPGALPGAIIPGAVCTAAAGATIPTVTLASPTNGNQFVTTSTNGVAGGGKLITASFSLAMDGATINATTFTLTPVGGAALVPVSVTLDAANKVATLTTAVALLADTSYTAIITIGAKSATGTPLACAYAWSFKTVSPAAIGLASVNFGLAAPFGIAATAGVTNTATAPNTIINGDVVLEPVAGATCNAV